MIMNNRNKISLERALFVLFFMLLALHLTAQKRSCGFDHIMMESQAKDNKRFLKKIDAYLNTQAHSKSASEVIYTIPVVVHVVHNNPSGNIGGLQNSNITDEQIYSQIEVLNNDFRRLNGDANNTLPEFIGIAADVGIEFCLASFDPEGNPTSGITRTYSPVEGFTMGDRAQLSSIIYWPSDQYLNIWVTTLTGNFIGWAQFPSDAGLDGLGANQGDATTDGVTMWHRYFGNQIGTASGSDPYTHGRSLTHEVGHWLGLYHLWGTGSGNGCNNTDHIDDTPPQEAPSSSCNETSILHSCGSLNMYQNYMDYSFDQCMNLFTQGQKERMRAALFVSPRRRALLDSRGCCGSKGTVLPPFTDRFEYEELDDLEWSATLQADTLEWDLTLNGKGSSQAATIDFSNFDHPSEFDLVSPVLTMEGFETSILEFDLAYQYEQQSDENGLLVQVEINCGGDWQSLAYITSNDLTFVSNAIGSTVNDENYQHYIFELPESITDFASIRIRFLGLSESNGIFYLDNVNVHEETADFEFQLYPNPNDGTLFVNVTYEERDDVEIALLDIFGRVLLQDKVEEVKSKRFFLDLSHLPSQVYFVRVTTGRGTLTERVVLYR